MDTWLGPHAIGFGHCYGQKMGLDCEIFRRLQKLAYDKKQV